MTYRAAKTVTHELGHCLLIDHCVVYECLMNGTANLAEDDGGCDARMLVASRA